MKNTNLKFKHFKYFKYYFFFFLAIIFLKTRHFSFFLFSFFFFVFFFYRFIRDFVLSLVSDGVAFNEAIMNLPQSATDFLDVFIGLLNRKDKQGNRCVYFLIFHFFYILSYIMFIHSHLF